MSSTNKPSERLLEMARGRFDDLTYAETQLLDAAGSGEWRSCEHDDKSQRVIRPEVFRWLVFDTHAAALVHDAGIAISKPVFETALDLSFARIRGRLSIDDASFKQGLHILCASLGELALEGSELLLNDQGTALTADRLRVAGGVFLRNGFKATGEVRLHNATIDGNLECTGSHFIGNENRALSADGMKVAGAVFLRDGFSAKGVVRLPGTVIGGYLDCQQSRIENDGGIAIFADGMNVKHGVFLRSGFTATGSVLMRDATIGASLECDQSTFNNADGIALAGDGTRITGSIFLRDGCTAHGTISLVGTKMDDLQLWGGRFTGQRASSQAIAIHLHSTSITGFVALVHPTANDRAAEMTGAVSMRHARIGQIIDSPLVWEPEDNQDEPRPAPVALDGCEYESLGTHKDSYDVSFRKRWLASGAEVKSDGEESVFAPQPYTQLAKVMKQAGHEREARQILIEREEQRRTRMEFGPWEGRWLWVIKHALGYGYQPWRMLLLLVVMQLLGTGVFLLGYRTGGFVSAVPFVYVVSDRVGENEDGEAVYRQRYGRPFADRDDDSWQQSKEDGALSEYPEFAAFIYSLDALVPIVNLHQETYWMPRGWVRWYLWLHIAFGWIGTTLFVAGFTGIVRRE